MNKELAKIKRILVPIDFSPSSDGTIDYAGMLARQFQAEMILIHVIESAPYSVTDTMVVVNHEEALKTTAAALMDTLRKKCIEKGLPVKTELAVGTPYREIIKKSREEPIDLIVMGTRGRTGFEHLLIGSVAEKVVRLSICPVLTVRTSNAPE